MKATITYTVMITMMILMTSCNDNGKKAETKEAQKVETNKTSKI